MIQIGYCREINNDITAVGQQTESSFIDFSRGRWIAQKHSYPRHCRKTCYRASKVGIWDLWWSHGRTFRNTKLNSCLKECKWLKRSPEKDFYIPLRKYTSFCQPGKNPLVFLRLHEDVFVVKVLHPTYFSQGKVILKRGYFKKRPLFISTIFQCLPLKLKKSGIIPKL